MKELTILNVSSSIPEVELWTNDTCSSSNHPNTILAVITIVSAILTIPNIVGNMVNKLFLLYGIVVLVLRRGTHPIHNGINMDI